jgi:hypothetical protein
LLKLALMILYWPKFDPYEIYVLDYVKFYLPAWLNPRKPISILRRPIVYNDLFSGTGKIQPKDDYGGWPRLVDRLEVYMGVNGLDHITYYFQIKTGSII